MILVIIVWLSSSLFFFEFDLQSLQVFAAKSRVFIRLRKTTLEYEPSDGVLANA